MIFNHSLVREYESNTARLVYLSRESYSLYESLRNALKFMRKMGLPSIGNPVLKLENQVLTLVYSVMQHEINCELYSELMLENVIDEGLVAQLAGLCEMTNILAITYHEYLAKWTSLKEKEEKRLIEFSQLPISA